MASISGEVVSLQGSWYDLLSIAMRTYFPLSVNTVDPFCSGLLEVSFVR